MKRAKYETPTSKVEALLQVEVLTEAGVSIREALVAVSKATGISTRSMFRYRRLTDMVPRKDWAAVLTRKSKPEPQSRLVDCPQEALHFVIDLCQRGIGISESYRQATVAAINYGWGQLPSERTLRRRLDLQFAAAGGKQARRNALPATASD